MEYLNEKNKIELFKQFMISMCVCVQLLNALACRINSQNLIRSIAGTLTTTIIKCLH